ncbi:hypothetical protein COCOBI_15-0680 [Coccomyxa sp. Obi]|nr:hypothetical protein COCOBI_15-0680 [Coccomyxa sp. Obi]
MMHPSRATPRSRRLPASVAMLIFLSTSLLHAASQNDPAVDNAMDINAISQAQRDTYAAAAAGGASNDNILAAVKSLEEKAANSAISPQILAPTSRPSSHPVPLATLPPAYGPAYGPGYGSPSYARPPAYVPFNPQPPSYAPVDCTPPLDLNRLSQCCSASACLTANGTCGTVTPCSGSIGGRCMSMGENIFCSAVLGNHQAVINGKCNGEGTCTATDQAQVAMLCAPGSVQQQQCTEFPDRFLTCSADVSLTAQQSSGQVHILVAMGTSLGSCMADSDCSIGEMCSGKAPPGMCQPIAARGQC